MKAQDMLTLGLLLAYKGKTVPFKDMAAKTGLSVGEMHASQKRLVQSGMIKEGSRQPLPLAVREFLVHGLRYVFPARYGGRARGVVTLGGAPPLSRRMAGLPE